MRRILLTLLIIAGISGIAYPIIVRSPILGKLFMRYVHRDTNAKDPIKEEYFTKSLTSPVDSIFVVKHLRELYVYRHHKLLKIYKVALGDAPEGHKHCQGDEKTPEGLYYIDGKNPLSSCHKNLGISYPNNADRAYARKLGQPTGGDIKIHGLPNGQGYIGKAHLLHDWTNGCIGITDEEIDELYSHVKMGSPILIVP
jgi:murein L,D-transpeptidase YafK